MNKQCKQRQELLDFNTFIEARNGLGRVRQEQLKVWLEVEDYDEKTGDVYTRAGIFNKKDLQFRGGTDER